jgi:hypothetical protein
VANAQAQFGFRHKGYLGGGAPDYQLKVYTIASSYATAIGFGDVVTFTTSGTNTGTLIQCTPTLATTRPFIGIFQGCMLTPTTGGPPVWSPFYPAAVQGANSTAYVIDAPNAVYEVASFSAALGSTTIGNRVNFSGGVPTTTGGGFSTFTLDPNTSTAAGTTSGFLPFTIVQMMPGIGNGSDPTTNYNWVWVTPNFQQWKSFSNFP